MTPVESDEEKKKRITVNLEPIDVKIIEALEGVIAKKKASVIYQMMKEWINQNSDRIMRTWGIDLVGIRKEVLAETKGLPIKDELDRLDKEILAQLPGLFDTIKSISVEELSEILEVNQQTLKKIIFGYRKELLKHDLDLSYENGLIIKK